MSEGAKSKVATRKSVSGVGLAVVFHGLVKVLFGVRRVGAFMRWDLYDRPGDETTDENGTNSAVGHGRFYDVTTDERNGGCGDMTTEENVTEVIRREQRLRPVQLLMAFEEFERDGNSFIVEAEVRQVEPLLGIVLQA